MTQTVILAGTSRLDKRQFIDLIDFIYSYGAEHGVRWSEPMEVAQ